MLSKLAGQHVTQLVAQWAQSSLALVWCTLGRGSLGLTPPRLLKGMAGMALAPAPGQSPQTTSFWSVPAFLKW